MLHFSEDIRILMKLYESLSDYNTAAKEAELASKKAMKEKNNPESWIKAGQLHHKARVIANSIPNKPAHIDPEYHKDSSEGAYEMAEKLKASKSIKMTGSRH